MSELLSTDMNEEIDDVIGKELRGSLNEYMIMYLLLDNHENGPNKPGKGLTTRILADELEIPQSTTATVVKRLAKDGYVMHSKGEPVKITSQGIRIAKERIKHHHILEILFDRTLDLDPIQIHNEAIRLMLTASCDLIRSIDRCFDKPNVCPRGHKIPEVTICDEK